MGAPAHNTRTIARNSFWYGLEMAFGILIAFGTSIPMARIIGPEKLGYFNYIMWLANMTGTIGSMGIPSTTRKYIAEYLGNNQPAIARAIFASTLRLQMAMAAGITSASLMVLFLIGDPAHRVVSAIQIVSMFPSMTSFVAAQTNVARENMRANILASVVGGLIHLTGVISSLAFGWGLFGIAIGILTSRTVELVIRYVPVQRWINTLPHGKIPPELKLKMRSFSGQSMVILLLNIVVWNRSDMIVLKWRSADIAQITFFSVAFTISEKVTLAPQVFGQALGATVMAQYGRDKLRLQEMVSGAAKYMFLLAMPLLLGMAALSPAIIRLLYGHQYLPAIPVLALAAIFALPNPLLTPAQAFLQANERQGFLIAWCALAGVVNVGVDYLLIPNLGAMGAAIGNGTAQLMGVVGIWVFIVWRYAVHLPVASIVKIAISSALMYACVAPLNLVMRPFVAIALGVPLGGGVFVVLLRFTAALDAHDRRRILSIGNHVPAIARPLLIRAVGFVTAASSGESRR